MEPIEEKFTAEQILERLPLLATSPGLIAPLKNIFQYTQFLLDEEENLTRTGNLNSEARKLLHQRIFDVLDIVSPEAADRPDADRDPAAGSAETGP